MPTRYQTYRKRERLQQEISDRTRLLKREQYGPSGDDFDGGTAADRIQNLGALGAANERDKKRLAVMTPPDTKQLQDKGIKEPEKKIEKRLKQLEEAIINGNGGYPGMCSVREMQENPAGSTDKHLLHNDLIRHHNVTADGKLVRVDHKKGQQSMHDEWKDLRRILYKDAESSAPNIANLEVLRPDTVDRSNLANYAKRSYAPFAKLSQEEYAKRVGITGLTPQARKVAEFELADPVAALAEEED